MIQNPNSSGQGHDPDHAYNPYRATVESAGFEYSHSTPVRTFGGPTFVDNVLGNPNTIHHTYKRGPRSISVWRVRDEAHGVWAWRWEASARSGSAQRVGGTSVWTLRRYLKHAARHRRTERQQQAAITRRLAVPRAVAPHGRCATKGRCIEPVSDEERCR